jgi:hypothetical protein
MLQVQCTRGRQTRFLDLIHSQMHFGLKIRDLSYSVLARLRVCVCVCVGVHARADTRATPRVRSPTVCVCVFVCVCVRVGVRAHTERRRAFEAPRARLELVREFVRLIRFAHLREVRLCACARARMYVRVCVGCVCGRPGGDERVCARDCMHSCAKNVPK